MTLLAVGWPEAATLFVFSLSPVLSFAACLRENDAEAFPSPGCGLEHTQPAEPIAPGLDWQVQRGHRENFESCCLPMAACSPSLTVLCLQLRSDLQVPICRAGISHPDSLSSRGAPAVCPGWRAGFCYPTPHHLLWQYQQQARHGTLVSAQCWFTSL